MTEPESEPIAAGTPVEAGASVTTGSDGRPVGDTLPEDLDVTAYVGPYQFPDIKRRRVPGLLYAASGVVMLLVATLAGDGSVAVNRGVTVCGLVFLAIGAYHLVAGWPLKVDQTEALVAASRDVGFPIGHASAQLGWRGLLSRPTWRILLYSADTPPTKRGLVLVDAQNAQIVGQMVHDNPEDWSEYDD